MGNSSEPELILYDLPSKGRCACWSLNPWKSRLILNLKQLPYQTVWMEYPDIAPTFKEWGIPPHGPEAGELAPYTIPAMKFPNGDYLMGSEKIAARLEKDYPQPGVSLELDSPLQPKVIEMLPRSISPLRGVWLPSVPQVVLREPSAKFFYETREKRIGMPLSELAKVTDVEVAWKGAEPGLHQLGDLLREVDGPFLTGASPIFADIIIVGFLQFYKTIGPAPDGFLKRTLEIEPALETLYAASAGWLVRDDH